MEERRIILELRLSFWDAARWGAGAFWGVILAPVMPLVALVQWALRRPTARYPRR